MVYVIKHDTKGPRMPNIHPHLQGATENMLTPAEAAAVFRIDRATLTQWVKRGKIPCTRTPMGHRRYRESDVIAMLNGTQDFTGRTDLETYRPEPEDD